MSVLRLLGLCMTGLLAGCSLLGPQPEAPPESDSWQAHEQRLLALSQWQMHGKIGIRTPQENNSASILWRQDDADYQIELSGPFGQGGARIAGNDHGVQIDIAGEPPLQAASPEQLMETTLGWQFPVRELLFWIRGIPAPSPHYTQVLAENRLLSLKQNNWNIKYLRYTQLGEFTLPAKLLISRDDMRITIVMKEWLLTP